MLAMTMCPVLMCAMLTVAESLFRTNLESKETELEGLQRSVVDLKHQIKLKDKTCSETKKLRDVIRLQDEKVRVHTNDMYMCSLIVLIV